MGYKIVENIWMNEIVKIRQLELCNNYYICITW